jgi:serine/threonine-protein kinase
LDGPIGSGGMGHVYRGRDLILDRVVAVKVLPAELARDAGAVRRFGREARAVARLSHPGIVTVFDAGVADGAPFIVMEFVEGRTLAEVLRHEGRLTPSRAAAIVAAIADALADAHASGVVHRDIKPGNVMLVAGGEVRVMDFGIALPLDADATVTRAALGTPSYASPEQASGEPTDARSDVYALGAVLYELLTGGPPFQSDSALGVLAMHQGTVPDRPSSHAPGIPPALDGVVATALAKRPEDRYPSASAMAGALRRASGSHGAAQVGTVPDVATVPTESPTARLDDDATTVLPPSPSPRRMARVALLAAVLVALLLLALVASPGGAKPTAPSPTTPAGPVVVPSADHTPSPHPAKGPKCKDDPSAPGCHGNGDEHGPGNGPGQDNGD